ncbi:UNVERIFIED_CONTAM: hypothetical protein H355_002107 [Colinus virginianus]|nr:hypothetical protein H355_002107 [Colinus virginianus]
MENGGVYNETTEPRAKPPLRRRCGCTLRHLRGWRLPHKALQPVLSLLAVIFEEIVEDCINCHGLYFFEFVSCTAFLLSLLILCVYCTIAYETFGKDKVNKAIVYLQFCNIDFFYLQNFWTMLTVGAFFLVASIALAATSSGSAFEKTACVFGFFASGAFLAEFIWELWCSRKQSTEERSENPGHTQVATEDQPLNKPS